MKITVTKTDHGMMLNADSVQTMAAIGQHGLIAADNKQEGDGKTPIGTWPLRCIYYRPDRITLPACTLPGSACDAVPITPDMGWCDDATHPTYNTEISLPFAASHEVMWRDDHAYDVVIPLGYNDEPPVPGRGSAIFFHLLHEGKNHTAGCVAIPHDAMLKLLEQITTNSVMTILAQ